MIKSFRKSWLLATHLGQISQAGVPPTSPHPVLILASFLFITVCSQHFKAPYGLNCGSFLGTCELEIRSMPYLRVFNRLIIFTGHTLRSPRATSAEIQLTLSGRSWEGAKVVQSNVKETNEKRCPPDVSPTRLNAWRFD